MFTLSLPTHTHTHSKQLKNFQRSRSVGSGDSKSLMLVSPDEHSRSLSSPSHHSHAQSPSTETPLAIDSAHLNTLAVPLDAMSTNSSSSSQYHSAHSRTPSTGTMVGPGDDGKESDNGVDITGDTGEGGKDEESNKEEVKTQRLALTDTTGTRKSRSPPKNLGLLGPKTQVTKASKDSLQSSLMSHLSTVLLSENETEVIGSAQVLCELVSQFVVSLQGQYKVTLSEDEFTNDPLMQKVRNKLYYCILLSLCSSVLF